MNRNTQFKKIFHVENSEKIVLCGRLKRRRNKNKKQKQKQKQKQNK